MKTIDVHIPLEAYDRLLAKFGSRKRIEDVFSVRLEDKIKRELYLLRIRGKDILHKQKLTIYIDDSLYPYLNEFCIHRSQSKQEVVIKMINKNLSR